MLRGTVRRSSIVYARLEGPDSELLISATLDYITQQLRDAEIQETNV